MRHSVFIIVMALLLAGVLGESLSSASRVVLAQTAPTAVPTALANERPDRCEHNNSREEPCVLPLDAVSAPFTFLPDGDQDYYSVDLGDQPGLALNISVRGTSGLDLLTTVSRAGDNATLATISSPAISTTLSADLIGWVILRVENRAPAVASGESYSIELRRVLPPPPATPDAQAGQLPLAPDPLENNWSPATAAPIGVGYVYDLNFVCPVPWGCAGGDHDYLAVPVKAGVRYLIATFDLGPGVDTVIDLFWGNEQVPIATNDDARPGFSFLSVLRWAAPSDGTAVIRVGPRTGAANPIVFDKDASSYRFAIVLADSDLGHQLEERIATQTGSSALAHQGTAPAAGTGAVNDHAPAPITVTPIPTVAPDAPKGLAIVAAESSVLRDGPRPAAAAIQTLEQEAIVTLLGQAVGAWVRVQPEGGVVPGWVYGPDLRALSTTSTATTWPASGQAATPNAPTAVSPISPTLTSLPQVTALDRTPLPPPPTPAPRVPLAVTVRVGAANEPPVNLTPNAVRAGLTPTPGAQRPLAGVRVQLVTVFGDLLAEAVTPASGEVTLTRDLPPEMAVLMRVPALGLESTVDRSQPSLTIAVPDGGTP